jgi:hypothetical protein
MEGLAEYFAGFNVLDDGAQVVVPLFDAAEVLFNGLAVESFLLGDEFGTLGERLS